MRQLCTSKEMLQGGFLIVQLSIGAGGRQNTNYLNGIFAINHNHIKY